MKINARILFASFAALVSVALVGSTSMAAGPVDPAKQEALKKNIVKFAQSKLGTKVDLGQGGECTELIQAALKQYGGQPMFYRKTMVFVDGKGTWVPTYGWGSQIIIATKGKTIQIPPAGSIVQFEHCVFKTGNTTSNMPHHTAIVESVNGTMVTLLHQNVNGSLDKSVVRRQIVDFAGKQKGGGFTAFYPVPQK